MLLLLPPALHLAPDALSKGVLRLAGSSLRCGGLRAARAAAVSTGAVPLPAAPLRPVVGGSRGPSCTQGAPTE